MSSFFLIVFAFNRQSSLQWISSFSSHSWRLLFLFLYRFFTPTDTYFFHQVIFLFSFLHLFTFTSMDMFHSFLYGRFFLSFARFQGYFMFMLSVFANASLFRDSFFSGDIQFFYFPFLSIITFAESYFLLLLFRASEQSNRKHRKIY